MKHVFVVDDEQNIRDILQKYIENEGYKVTLFSDGRQVYEEMLRLKPDLLVIDIMMPHLAGLELCKKSVLSVMFQSFLCQQGTANLTGFWGLSLVEMII
ncbi:response regulator [Neobacillus citreus]|uniref:Response regulator n=1 Tax=Neobacillus citreus TaxID=2833578 RepID=A0A942T2S4_9BACI|nr:response regulator [Neobacillus citreus]MCH6269626.1 response regulator [Neobacillus citreus]